MVLKNLFKKFPIDQIIRLMMDLLGQLNIQMENISIYSPVSGSTYTELPDELKHPKKGLINLTNNGNKCFLWCHVRDLNPLNKNLQRIAKVDKATANNLDYKDIKFPVSKKNYQKIEQQNIYLH